MPKRKNRSPSVDSASSSSTPSSSRNLRKKKDIYDSTSSEDDRRSSSSRTGNGKPQKKYKRTSSSFKDKPRDRSVNSSHLSSREDSSDSDNDPKRDFLDKLMSQDEFNEFPGSGCIKLHFTQLGKLTITGDNLELLGLYTKCASHRLQYTGSDTRIEVDIERVTSLAVRGRQLQVAYTPLARSLLDMDLPQPQSSHKEYRSRPHFGEGRGRAHYGEEPRSRPHYEEEPRGRAYYGEEPRSRPHYGEEPRSRPHYGEDYRGRPRYGEEPRGRPHYGEEPRGRPHYEEEPRSRPHYGESRGRSYYGEPRSRYHDDDSQTRPFYGNESRGRPHHGDDQNGRRKYNREDRYNSPEVRYETRSPASDHRRK